MLPFNVAAYRAYIKENFIRTWHIAIFNDPGESKEDNYRKAQEALEKLENGSADMYRLIGSTYNEDLMLTTTTGYYFAKDIIKLIWSLGEEIEKDPVMREKIRVVFLEDYNVSTAEILMPATDISEQISLAGKEASGTGCMKFMINGALTVGTLDGANVEMAEAVGRDNIYIFGLTANDVDELWRRGYSSIDYYRNSERIRRVMDMISRGFNGSDFSGIVNYFISSPNISDPYMCLADFDSYFNTYSGAVTDYADRKGWTVKSLKNIAGAGYFASDRSIREYAENIWHIKPVE